MSRPPVWDRRRVVDALRAWTDQHGRPPRRRDWMSSGPGHPQGGVVYRLFGSWPAALIAAGLDSPPPGPPQRKDGWDHEAIVDAILEWAERFGEPPAAVDWNPALARARGEHARADLFEAERPRWPVQAAVRHHCGSWNAALQAATQRTTVAGLKRSAPRPAIAPERAHSDAWSAAEVLAAIRAHRDEHGRAPTYDEWAPGDPAGRRPSTRTVLRIFGSWSAAVHQGNRSPSPAGAPRHRLPRPRPSSKRVCAPTSLRVGLERLPPIMSTRSMSHTARARFRHRLAPPIHARRRRRSIRCAPSAPLGADAALGSGYLAKGAADRVVGEPEHGGDLPGAEALAEQLQDLGLAFRRSPGGPPAVLEVAAAGRAGT